MKIFRKNFIKILLILLLLTFIFSLVVPNRTHAQLNPLGTGFGGRILFSFPCLNGLFVVVGPPSPGVFLYQFGVSNLHQYFQLRPGPWALGAKIPGGVCIQPFPLPPIPVQGTIRSIGTSLF